MFCGFDNDGETCVHSVNQTVNANHCSLFSIIVLAIVDNNLSAHAFKPTNTGS